MSKFKVELSHTTYSTGVIQIEAESQAEAEAKADEIGSDDSRIKWTPIDGELNVDLVEEVSNG